MSVNAINAADPQQRKSNPAGAAIAGAAVGAVAGGVPGYFWGGGKKVPTLEEVFAQTPDEFKSSMKAATDAGKDAGDISKVEAGRKAYDDAIEGAKNELEQAQKAYDSHVNAVSDDFNEDVKNAKSDFDTKSSAKREVQEYNEKGEIVKNGENISKKGLTATEMKAKVDEIKASIEAESNATKKAELQSNLAKVKEEYKAELDALEESKSKLYKAKETAFLATDAAKDETTDAGKAVKNLAGKKSALDTAKETAKKEITEETKTAFGKIKGALKEIKWGKIGMWAGIGAAALAIVGYMLGSSKNDVA